jgi:shikimate kinase
VKNIVLTGFMGTGKTEVGKILAQKLGYQMIDSDSEIERDQGLSINEIFEKQGEQFFRDIEADVIKRLSERKNCVISTGGGAVLRQANIDNLRRTGVIVCLTADPETILQRTAGDNERPLLQTDNPLQRIKELLAIRRPFYEKSDIMIDTKGRTPLEISEEIIKEIRDKAK